MSCVRRDEKKKKMQNVCVESFFIFIFCNYYVNCVCFSEFKYFK